MTITSEATPEALHARMIDAIAADRQHHPRTLEALRAAPRHELLRAINPDVSLEDAYDPELAVITQTHEVTGAALSCSSVPTLVATMLDQADVQPGDNVLEIGSATGINAAYLAYLTGPTGKVTTLDIDEWVTDGTRRALDANGYRHIRVVTRDGALGYAEDAPYDKIVVTVGAWDIAEGFWDQLAPDGRLVIPLRWRGQARSIAFVRDGDRLRSESVELCGFVPMIGQEGEKSGAIDAEHTVILHWDQDQAIDPAALLGVLDQAKTETWTDVTVESGEPFDGIWLRLTATEPGTCRIEAKPEAAKSGRCTPPIPSRSPALVEGDSLAYFILRLHQEEPRRWKLGAAAHGPAGEQLAVRLCAQIIAWDTARNENPEIVAYRGETPPVGQLAITKPECALTVNFTAGC